MKKTISKIIVIIGFFLVAFPCFSQDIMPKAGLKYEIRYVFTGIVNQPLDSVYMDVCIIYNASLTGNEQLLVGREKDTVTIKSTGNKLNRFINKNGYSIVVLGYMDPYNPSKHADIVSGKALSTTDEPAQGIVIDAALAKQLKNILDTNQNK